jgi:hypothetical protein
MRSVPRLVAVLLLLGSVTLYAQEGARGQSPGAMAERATTLENEIQDAYRQSLALKEKARKQNDVIKLNCVNDKLMQLKAQMNLADTAKQSLDGALDSGSPDAAQLMGEYQAVADSAKQLLEETRACIGEPELYKQEAGVDVQPPDRPDDPGIIDPYNPDGPGILVEPPGYASPFN